MGRSTRCVLEPEEKAILTAMYTRQISIDADMQADKQEAGHTSDEIVNSIAKRYLLSTEAIQAKIDRLVRNQIVKRDRHALTEIGRGMLRVVLAGGVFDIIHPGHIHTLNAAKALGDVLVVVVATDNTAIKMKKKKPLHTQVQRQELVRSLLMVDLCMIGQEKDIFKTVDMVRPQIIALGYDQVHQEKFIVHGCERIHLDARVARLQSPIPEDSSSNICREYGDDIHGI